MGDRPRYLDAVIANLKGRKLSHREVVHVEIRHDDDCGIFCCRPCDCEPEVERGSRVNRKYPPGAV